MAGFGAQYSLLFTDEFYRRLHLPAYRSSYSDWVKDFTMAAPNIRISPASVVSMTPEELRQYIIAEQIKNARKITPSLRGEIQIFADSVENMYKDNL